MKMFELKAKQAVVLCFFYSFAWIGTGVDAVWAPDSYIDQGALNLVLDKNGFLIRAADNLWVGMYRKSTGLLNWQWAVWPSIVLCLGGLWELISDWEVKNDKT